MKTQFIKSNDMIWQVLVSNSSRGAYELCGSFTQLLV